MALFFAIGWQLCMTLAGVLLEHWFSNHSKASISLLSHTSYWDGGWYLSIIHGAYGTNAAAPAFYPLFPLLIYVAGLLSFGLLSTLAVGLLVNTISLWLATVAIVRIASALLPKKYSKWVLILFITSPAALFLHLFYGEAIFCALAFWSYLFALKKQWRSMALALALLSAARLPAILYVGLCALEFAQAYRWRLKEIWNLRLLWFLAAPVGFLAYGAYLLSIRHDFLAMFHAYHATNDWSYHVFNPNFIETILRASYSATLAFTGQVPLDSNQLVSNVLPIIGLVLLGAASLYIIFREKRLLPLAIFGLVSIVFFTLNNNTISVHRYLLPCLTLYIVAPIVVEKYQKLKPLLYCIAGVGLLLQTYLFVLFISSRFAG